MKRNLLGASFVLGLIACDDSGVDVLGSSHEPRSIAEIGSLADDDGKSILVLGGDREIVARDLRFDPSAEISRNVLGNGDFSDVEGFVAGAYLVETLNLNGARALFFGDREVVFVSGDGEISRGLVNNMYPQDFAAAVARDRILAVSGWRSEIRFFVVERNGNVHSHTWERPEDGYLAKVRVACIDAHDEGKASDCRVIAMYSPSSVVEIDCRLNGTNLACEEIGRRALVDAYGNVADPKLAINDNGVKAMLYYATGEDDNKGRIAMIINGEKVDIPMNLFAKKGSITMNSVGENFMITYVDEDNFIYSMIVDEQGDVVEDSSNPVYLGVLKELHNQTEAEWDENAGVLKRSFLNMGNVMTVVFDRHGMVIAMNVTGGGECGLLPAQLAAGDSCVTGTSPDGEVICREGDEGNFCVIN